jgi:enterochelin esterase-like enzyme
MHQRETSITRKRETVVTTNTTALYARDVYYYQHGRDVPPCIPTEAVSEEDLEREVMCTLHVVHEQRQGRKCWSAHLLQHPLVCRAHNV